MLASTAPFAAVSTADVDLILKKVCESLGVKKVTTYSFRHNFIERVKKYCEASGEDATRYTGHASQNMLDSHYGEADWEEGDE